MSTSRARYMQGTNVIRTHAQLKNTKLIWWHGKPMNVSFLVGMPYNLVSGWLERGMLVEAVLKTSVASEREDI